MPPATRLVCGLRRSLTAYTFGVGYMQPRRQPGTRRNNPHRQTYSGWVRVMFSCQRKSSPVPARHRPQTCGEPPAPCETCDRPWEADLGANFPEFVTRTPPRSGRMGVTTMQVSAITLTPDRSRRCGTPSGATAASELRLVHAYSGARQARSPSAASRFRSSCGDRCGLPIATASIGSPRSVQLYRRHRKGATRQPGESRRLRSRCTPQLCRHCFNLFTCC